MATLGHMLTIAALVLSLAAVVIFVLAVRQREVRWARLGRWAVLAVFACTTAAAAILLRALLTDDFSFAYVVQQSNIDLATIYKISAWWSGQQGSLLFWLWILTTFIAVIARSERNMANPLWPAALGILATIAAFFAALVVFLASPFEALSSPPPDGRGLQPLLQSYWMISHPVALYLGFVGFSVPFAFAMGALITRQPGDEWILITKRWSLVAWLFLSLGMLLGARWAYEELGWGGYWGWDPVENASMIPWLTATAYIHSVIITERRGMLRRWTVLLVLLTFLLTIFGTFLTRSGILASVHSFVESDIGTWFIVFLGLMLGGGLYLMTSRREMLQDERLIQSYASKEFSFLLNNLLFIGLAFAVFWGTVYPLVSRLFGVEITVGAPYFDRITAPMFIGIVLLMGIGPMLAWRRATWANVRSNLLIPLINGVIVVLLLLFIGVREFGILVAFGSGVFVATTILLEILKGVWARLRFTDDSPWLVLPRLFNRNPRRYGGYIVHLGVVLIVLGIAGHQYYHTETLRSMNVGAREQVGPYTVVFEGLERGERQGVPYTAANLLVLKDGRTLGYLRPMKLEYPGFFEMQGAQTEVAIYSTWMGDLYAVLAGWTPYGSLVGFQFFWNPFVGWIWAGGVVLLAGAVFAAWPRRQRSPAPSRRALEALRELEYDFAMQKVARREYEELRAELMAAAGQAVDEEELIRSAVERELKEGLQERLGRMRGIGPAES